MTKPTKPKPGAITITQPTPPATALQQAGKAADQAAARAIFAEALARMAANSVRRARADIELFTLYLRHVGVPVGDLQNDPQAWRGLTWGIVEGFKAWQLGEGYAIASINGRLSTVRKFATLAAKAGAISPDALRMIQTAQGYTNRDKTHIDEKRAAEGLPTRKGHKKPAPVKITNEAAAALIAQPETMQGARDRLLMCLLLHHGLRVSEIAILKKSDFDIPGSTITFYRPKVRKTQTHKMTPATRAAARAYLPHAPSRGAIWRKTNRSGALSGPMSTRSITRALAKRVNSLGARVGISGLSPHDARHFCATFEAQSETPINRIVEMFGWNSYAMARRYIDAAAIANEGTARIKKRKAAK